MNILAFILFPPLRSLQQKFQRKISKKENVAILLFWSLNVDFNAVLSTSKNRINCFHMTSR